MDGERIEKGQRSRSNSISTSPQQLRRRSSPESKLPKNPSPVTAQPQTIAVPQVVQQNRNAEQQEVRKNTQNLKIPALVHFVWIGKKPTQAAVENINRWVNKAKNTDWKIYLWTDKRYGKPKLLNGNWGLKGKIENKEISQALDKRLSQHYERAVSKKTWNMASDLARYSILAKQGGVYADVDIGPGNVSLKEISDSSALFGGELPLFGPGLRDEQQLDRMVPPNTEDTLKKRLSQAIEELNTTGQFGNHFIAAPSQNDLIEKIIIACEKKLKEMDVSDIEPGLAMMTTGPTIVLQQINHYLQEKGVSTDESRAAIDRMNPLLNALFANLDWLTKESENQTHL